MNYRILPELLDGDVSGRDDALPGNHQSMQSGGTTCRPIRTFQALFLDQALNSRMERTITSW